MAEVKGMIGLQVCVTQSIVQSRLGGVHGSGATIQYQTRLLAAQCKSASAFRITWTKASYAGSFHQPTRAPSSRSFPRLGSFLVPEPGRTSGFDMRRGVAMYAVRAGWLLVWWCLVSSVEYRPFRSNDARVHETRQEALIIRNGTVEGGHLTFSRRCLSMGPLAQQAG